VWRVILIGGLALNLILAVAAAWIETPTVDEYAHVPAGMSYWKHGDKLGYFPWDFSV